MNGSLNYSLDDVLLAPSFSTIESRSDVDLSCSIGNLGFSNPLVSSPMDTVTEAPFAWEMVTQGGFPIIHRYMTTWLQAQHVKRVVSAFISKELEAPNVGAAIGISGNWIERARALVDAGASALCIDVSHGHHQRVGRVLLALRREFGNEFVLIAGNVATAEGFRFLADNGADAIRVGIGNGSICSTRLQCGVGVPQATAIASCAEVKGDTKLIADGGCKTPGDIVKSLALGADMVILGSMLAACDESPGKTKIVNGKLTKVYRGMASGQAQRDYNGSVRSVEGIATRIPTKGKAAVVISNMCDNLRAGLSYCGARNINELQMRARFIQASHSSLRESNTHILEQAVSSLP